MYRECPKCGHQREDNAAIERCPACGLIYEKWLRRHLRQDPSTGVARARRPDRQPRLRVDVRELLLYTPEHVNVLMIAGRAALWLLAAGWTLSFATMDYTRVDGGFNAIGETFMHRVNLVFHEAGHVLFAPFGDFLMTLGGTLGQLLMPAVVTAVFLFRERNTFGAAIGTCWLGQSLVDCAPYIADARAGQLLLLGGVTGRDAPGYHDWESILGTLGLMHLDHTLAGITFWSGIALMTAACGWGAWLLALQWRRRDRRF